MLTQTKCKEILHFCKVSVHSGVAYPSMWYIKNRRNSDEFLLHYEYVLTWIRSK